MPHSLPVHISHAFWVGLQKSRGPHSPTNFSAATTSTIIFMMHPVRWALLMVMVIIRKFLTAVWVFWLILTKTLALSLFNGCLALEALSLLTYFVRSSGVILVRSTKLSLAFCFESSLCFLWRVQSSPT